MILVGEDGYSSFCVFLNYYQSNDRLPDMTVEQEQQQEGVFFADFQKKVLSHIIPDGREVSVFYNKKQFTLCLQQVSTDGPDVYSLILAAYKRQPFNREMWHEVIGHIDINVAVGTAFLSTSRIGGEVSIGSLVPPLQASEVAFRDRATGNKIDAIEVEEHKRGQGYGILLYALGKAVLRNRGFTGMSIVGATSEAEGFYEKLNATQDPNIDYVKYTKLTFNAAEQKVLGSLRIVGAIK